MRHSSRRTFLMGVAAAAIAPRTASAQSSTYPDRPIRLIVPWPAGNSADVVLRVLSEQARIRLGQPIVIENRPGATGSLGLVALKTARPDGYTLAQSHLAIFRTALLTTPAPFDPLRDFSHVIQLTGSMIGVVVRADSPWQTLQDVLDYAKANPDKLNYGTVGVGSSMHLVMEQIAAARGLKWTHVAYKGAADVLSAVAGGQLQVAVDTSWGALVESGRLRLLATFGAERPARFKQAPTLKEAGLDIVITSPWGIVGPRDMDPAVVRVLHDAYREALFSPAGRAVLDKFDLPLLYLNGADYAAAAPRHLAEERVRLQTAGLLPK